MIVLSHIQARPILQAQAQASQNGPSSINTSLDLGVTTAEISLHQDGILLPDGQRLTWQQLAEICDNELACYHVVDSQIRKIQYFSDAFNRFYSLMPTVKAPTMLISGFPMHRIKETDPYQDTLSKIRAIAPARGQVLDTTMGLGYTAIAAAKTADHVTTIELDPTVLEICRHNPWSQALFDNPTITQLTGDAYDLAADFAPAAFGRIIHDPPTFSLAGDLYAADFYHHLHRILQPKGRLFHYIGDPNSKSGRTTTRGVIRRLQAVGFKRVKPYPQAFGVVAYR